jgi:hypothetical protein
LKLIFSFCFKLLLVISGICCFRLSGYTQTDFYDINYIREIRIRFKESNWDHILDSLFSNYGENAKLEGDISIDGHVFYGVGIRYKGYSSWDEDQVKNPFNIELDYKRPNQNYQGFTRLKLSNVVRDPSFIREALSYEILRKYMPASQANFANVYVNDVLIGLYTNVETVDKIFAEKHFGSGKNSFFKGSPEILEYPYGENANLAYSHGTDSSGYIPYYSLVSDYGWNDLLKLINILNNDTSDIPSILNIDRALWMHAFDYSLVNLDSYIGYSQNYYMYKDDNGVFNSIIWDMNMSFGSFRNTDATTLSLSIPKIKQLNPLQILYINTFSPRPLIKNLLSNSTYRKMFLAHMRTIINENFRNNDYYVRGKQIQAIIDPYVQNDTNKFFSYTNFIKNIDTTVGPTSNQYPGIKDLMEARIAYLDTFPGFYGYPDIVEIRHKPEIPSIGEQTWFRIKVINANKVMLGYRNNCRGIFQKILMYDDGNHNDSLAGDYIYGAAIIPDGKIVQYFMYAENNSAGVFLPERAEFEFYSLQTKLEKGDIVFNEFSEDWIEMFNNTNESIELTGMYLSDEKNILSKWTFPDIYISAKEYLIVRTNENPTYSLHTNFSLNEEGGGLYLSDHAGGIVDSIAYGMEETGKSIGRYPNGIGSFVYMPHTFAYSNNLGTIEGNELLIYPNPANEKITIEFMDEKQPYSIEIFDASGRSVMYNKFNTNNTSMPVTSHTIDMSGLGKGVFVLKLGCSTRILTKRFIII